MTTTATPPALKLSDLSMRIDIRSFYEAHRAIVSGKPTNSPRDGKEYASSCPRCGGTDRFSFWDSGRFCCIRGNCNNWHGSSPYFFLKDEGYSHAQALEELGIEQSELGDSYSQQKPPALPLFLVADEPPNKKWMEAAMGFCRACEHVLWDTIKGQSARDYLHSRGFKDDTIKQARLGLNPDWWEAPLSNWGLDASQLNKEDDPRILIPRGIIIPWYVDGSIHKIQLRRPAPGPDGKFYKEILGSSNLLYNVDSIQSDKPVMLVESELDALSVHQEASDLIACVATGGSGKALSGRPIARLSHASFILQSFDDDEPGEAGAEKWLNAFENSERWSPLAHDCNDMLKEKISIRSWVEQGLQVIAQQGEEMGEWTLTHDDGSVEIILLPTTPPALYDLAGQIIPAQLIATIPNLVERVITFQQACLSRKKICCDTLDWMIDPQDGRLICPCVEKARKENELHSMSARPMSTLPPPPPEKPSHRTYWQR